jgi:hypothetical protein
MRSTSSEAKASASLAGANMAEGRVTQHFDVCEDCDGRGTLGYGYEAWPPIDCPTCKGAGLMEVWR